MYEEGMYKEIKTREEAVQFQKEKYGEYCEKYKERKAIMDDSGYEYKVSALSYAIEGYIGNSFLSINQYLRSSNKNEKTTYCYYLKAQIDRINEIIYWAPPIDEDIIVYRGVDENGIENIMKMVKVYGSYFERAFLSTSLRLDTVLEEIHTGKYKYILKIYVPKGTPALGTDRIEDRMEEEILFPVERTLRYIRKEMNWKIKKKIYVFELQNI